MLSLLPHSGLPLPPFKTLLVKGEYHISAPIHLALSCAAESSDNQTILISPSRHNLTQALQQYNDEWLKLNSGHGNVLSLSSRIKIFYPPSLAHLCLLFSTLRVLNLSDTGSEAWLNKKTILTVPPSMIILHEPSAYFLADHDLTSSEWTISSYISAVAHLLSSLTLLSRENMVPGGLSAALFDSRLDQLKLPMFKQPTLPMHDDADKPDARLEFVYSYVQKYFDWIAIAGEEEIPALDIGARRKRTMVLIRGGEGGRLARSWEWWEEFDIDETDERRATRFSW